MEDDSGSCEGLPAACKEAQHCTGKSPRARPNRPPPGTAPAPTGAAAARAVLSDHRGQAGPQQPPLRAAARPQQPTWSKTGLEARKRSRSAGRRPKRGLLAHTAVKPHSGRRDRRLRKCCAIFIVIFGFFSWPRG